MFDDDDDNRNESGRRNLTSDTCTAETLVLSSKKLYNNANSTGYPPVKVIGIKSRESIYCLRRQGKERFQAEG